MTAKKGERPRVLNVAHSLHVAGVTGGDSIDDDDDGANGNDDEGDDKR